MTALHVMLYGGGTGRAPGSPLTFDVPAGVLLYTGPEDDRQYVGSLQLPLSVADALAAVVNGTTADAPLLREHGVTFPGYVQGLQQALDAVTGPPIPPDPSLRDRDVPPNPEPDDELSAAPAYLDVDGDVWSPDADGLWVANGQGDVFDTVEALGREYGPLRPLRPAP